MLDWIKVNKVYVAGGVLMMITALYFVFQPEEEPNTIFENAELLMNEEDQLTNENTPEEVIDENVIVDVKGAVKKPGVYKAKANERVIDMINKAGGLMETADESKINFAVRVVDEMVIYVPKFGEEPAEIGGEYSDGAAAGQGKNDGKVNLNTANETELQTLPGIGPAKAAAIIEFRETNGPFKVIEDLKAISGIGDKTFEKLQEQIKVK